jgi:hypothetical protein
VRAVTFIDSTGIRALLNAHHQARASGATVSINLGAIADHPVRPLELTGITDYLDLDPAPATEPLTAAASALTPVRRGRSPPSTGMSHRTRTTPSRSRWTPTRTTSSRPGPEPGFRRASRSGFSTCGTLSLPGSLNVSRSEPARTHASTSVRPPPARACRALVGHQLAHQRPQDIGQPARQRITKTAQHPTPGQSRRVSTGAHLQGQR